MEVHRSGADWLFGEPVDKVAAVMLLDGAWIECDGRFKLWVDQPVEGSPQAHFEIEAGYTGHAIVGPPAAIMAIKVTR